MSNKNIHSLIPDIYDLVQRKDGWFNEQLAQSFSTDLARRLQGQLGENTRRPTLRLSQMGPRCPRALWYSIHHPEMAEVTPPWAEIKFSFGHILEALVLTLAKASGHDVTGEQDALELDGIVGHRDCVIDGYTVDIKSASSLSFQKFKNANYELVDNFGYLDQLDGYVVAAANDPLVLHKDTGFILAVDKQLGHMYLYEHKTRDQSIRARIARYKSVVSHTSPPPCECKTETIGASGNRQLDFKARYSAYKYCCFPHLRTFLYAQGPVFLTEVKRKPDVPEVDSRGRLVYN